MDSINSKRDFSFSTDSLPMLFVSNKTQEVIKVNKAFENHSFASSKVVGRSLEEITQPIFNDDLAYSADKEREKNTYFSQLEYLLLKLSHWIL